ncbi:DNA polymerase [Actinophytocola sp. NPDC049390]|uniref:DNA polymerase n=1 Tax=Actinophytocola sp. NPDC049390 TaxID=3363894 RepID=UPI0037991E48
MQLERAWELMHDTVIPAKLADPQSTGSDPGLKALSGALLGDLATAPAADAARKALFKAGRWNESTGWAHVSHHHETMVRYDASDVLDTAAVALKVPWPEPEVLERERLAQRMTARVAHRGLRIDGEHVDRMLTKHEFERNVARDHVQGFGVDNPGSAKQVGDRLIELGATLPETGTGKPSVAAEVLEGMRETEGPAGELVRAVLDYRHHDKAVSAFLEPYRDLVVNGDGRARPTVYTLAADTGRMSCVRPNLQQVPQKGGFRACITADPGHLLISADFSGVETRVAAALSQDANLMRYIADEDAGLSDGLHWAIAREVWGPEATKADRYRAKRIVFGRLYGGGVPTLAKQAGVSESVAASAVDVIDALTPQLAAWSEQTRREIRAGQTQFRSYSGRVIHLPREFPHKGPNFKIQGTARELLVDVFPRWRDTQWGDCTLLPIHDELIAMVPEDEAEEATATLVRCMEAELFGVRIVVESDPPSFAWQDAV